VLAFHRHLHDLLSGKGLSFLGPPQCIESESRSYALESKSLAKAHQHFMGLILGKYLPNRDQELRHAQ
jgi:hypothetical protein